MQVRVDTCLAANGVVMVTAAVAGGTGVELEVGVWRAGHMDRPLPPLRKRERNNDAVVSWEKNGKILIKNARKNCLCM